MTSKIRILFVTSHWGRWASFEWLSKHLDRDKFEISWVVMIRQDSPPIIDYLRACNVSVYEVPYINRYDQLLAPMRIAQLCWRNHYDIVHTHFYNANMAGLLGSLLGGVKHRLHTRHYADALDGCSWRKLKAKLYNLLSTRIIAPSGVVQTFLLEQERVCVDKIALIYHGFDFDCFRSAPQHELEDLRQRCRIQASGPVIGVIARYDNIKGIQYIIPAFRQLLLSYPDAQLVLTRGATGNDYHSQIQTLLSTLPEDRYIELIDQDNVFALYSLFDVFIHAPILARVEAFGQVYIEALAAGVPSVFTPSGIASEFFEHGKTAWMVEHQNSEQIHDGIKRLLDDPELCQTLRHNGQQLVRDCFNLDAMIVPLERLYQQN